MSQVLALTYLAPDIQLEVLAMEAVDGVEPSITESVEPSITEKWIFETVARLLEWREQRVVWRNTRSRKSRAGLSVTVDYWKLLRTIC